MLDLIRRLAVAVSLSLLACAGGTGAAPTTSAPASPPVPTRPNTIPGEYLVTLAPEAGEGLIAERFGRFGIERVQGLGRNVFLVVFHGDPGLEALEGARTGESRMTSVQPNFVYRAAD